MLTALICDDEAPALDLLAKILERCDDVNLVAQCNDVRDALARLNEGGIDLAFLDVEMPGMRGVDMVSHIRVEPRPLFVFATAHPEYAVEAFGVDAIDYVLKPFDRTRIERTVARAHRLSSLIKAVPQTDAAVPTEYAQNPGTFVVKSGGHVAFVPHDEVIWIEAAGDYSLLHTASKEHALRQTIKSLEEALPSDRFVRIHRSTIVAKKHVRSVDLLSKGEAQLTMSSGTFVRASRTYREAVRGLLQAS